MKFRDLLPKAIAIEEELAEFFAKSIQEEIDREMVEAMTIIAQESKVLNKNNNKEYTCTTKTTWQNAHS
jgi:hypothetical protein